MKSICWRVLSALLGIAILAAGQAGAALADGRNRALERLLGRSDYSAEEGKRIQRSFNAAAEAGVRERDALALVEACIGGEFDAEQTQRLLSLAAQLALEDLPLDGFLAKVEEGVSKRVDTDRVVQAAERRGLALNKAKNIVNTLILQGYSVDDRDELLPDLAAALEAGRSPEEARAILEGALRDGDGPGTIRRKLFP